VCGYKGNRNDLSHFADYPADAVNWAVTVEGVSLKEGKKIFGGKGVIGGFDNTEKGVLYTGTQADVEAETRKIIADAGKTGIILGADCTIPADIALERLAWVRNAAK
jgi:uroporphyrinogen decarboxylase